MNINSLCGNIHFCIFYDERGLKIIIKDISSNFETTLTLEQFESLRNAVDIELRETALQRPTYQRQEGINENANHGWNYDNEGHAHLNENNYEQSMQQDNFANLDEMANFPWEVDDNEENVTAEAKQ